MLLACHKIIKNMLCNKETRAKNANPLHIKVGFFLDKIYR